MADEPIPPAPDEATEESDERPTTESGRLRRGRERLEDWLEWRNERRFPDDFAGHVHIWDIDETYLLTNLAGKLDLLRIALEKAGDKRHVPGAPALLRALSSSGPPDEHAPAIYFVSASPRQMREVLEAKLRADGVAFDGVTLKKWRRSIRRGRFFGAGRELRRHAPYKLASMLLYRRELPPGARITLVGDDSEQDAQIYALFADIEAGRLEGARLERALCSANVDATECDVLMALVEDGTPGDRVERILIRYSGKRERSRLEPFIEHSRGLIRGVPDFFGAALRLHADGQLNLEALVDVARAFTDDAGGDELELLRSLLDADRVRLVPPRITAAAFARLVESRLLPERVRYVMSDEDEETGEEAEETEDPARPITPPELLS